MQNVFRYVHLLICLQCSKDDQPSKWNTPLANNFVPPLDDTRRVHLGRIQDEDFEQLLNRSIQAKSGEPVNPFVDVARIKTDFAQCPLWVLERLLKEFRGKELKFSLY